MLGPESFRFPNNAISLSAISGFTVTVLTYILDPEFRKPVEVSLDKMSQDEKPCIILYSDAMYEDAEVKLPDGRTLTIRNIRPHECGTPQNTLCSKRSTLAHHALLQHHDAPPRRRRRRKFPHHTSKGARASGPPRHATQRSRNIAMPCLLQMPPCSGFGTASDSPCPDHGPTNQPTSKPCKPEPNEGSPSIAANEA